MQALVLWQRCVSGSRKPVEERQRFLLRRFQKALTASSSDATGCPGVHGCEALSSSTVVACSQSMRNLLRWPNQRFTQQCEGDEDLGNRLYQEYRQISAVCLSLCKLACLCSKSAVVLA